MHRPSAAETSRLLLPPRLLSLAAPKHPSPAARPTEESFPPPPPQSPPPLTLACWQPRPGPGQREQEKQRAEPHQPLGPQNSQRGWQSHGADCRCQRQPKGLEGDSKSSAAKAKEPLCACKSGLEQPELRRSSAKGGGAKFTDRGTNYNRNYPRPLRSPPPPRATRHQRAPRPSPGCTTSSCQLSFPETGAQDPRRKHICWKYTGPRR